MEFETGIWSQIEKLEPVYFKSSSIDVLTKALKEATEKLKPSTHPIYCGWEMADVIWDIVYDSNFITVYGIKLIGKVGDSFIYEGVLFDKFPDNYESLYISYRNRFDCERAEEIQVIDLTDTKIVFTCSFKFPEGKDNIILQWN